MTTVLYISLQKTCSGTCVIASLRRHCLNQGHRGGTLIYGRGYRDGVQIGEDMAQRWRLGAGTDIGRKKEKIGRGTEIGRSDAKICVYDNTIKNSG